MWHRAVTGFFLYIFRKISSTVIRMSWNALREMTLRVARLAFQKEQEKFFIFIRLENEVHYLSPQTLLHFLLSHRKLWTNTGRCAWKQEIQYTPLSWIHNKSSSYSLEAIHTKLSKHARKTVWPLDPDVSVKKQGIWFFLFKFSEEHLLWMVWKQRMWETKTVKILESRIKNLFCIFPLWSSQGDFSKIHVWSHCSPDGSHLMVSHCSCLTSAPAYIGPCGLNIPATHLTWHPTMHCALSSLLASAHAISHA